jgi:hypothetical protein
VNAIRATLLAAALLAAAGRAAAQEPRVSPIADVLRQARRALDNLEYGAADSLARSVLVSRAQVSRAERIEALLVLVAALYPEERTAQRRDSALAYLRQYVRTAPDGTIPAAISWYGLDSLLELARRTTFAAFARPRRDNTVSGAGGSIPIAVIATRPARFRLSLGRRGEAVRPLVVDSAGPARDAVLELHLFAGETQTVSSGEWLVTVTAADSATPDTVVQRFPVTVSAASLDLVSVPLALDSTQLRREWAPPSRGLAVAIGAGLGAATVLMVQAMRAPEPVSSAFKADSRAFVVAGGFVLGGVVGALLDKGHALPANVAYNSQLRADFAQRVLDAQQENERRRAGYRATVTIGEALP